MRSHSAIPPCGGWYAEPMPSQTSILPVNVDHLLHHRGVESERVEFKASWDAKTTGPQVLRTICAFANDYHNLNGGYVVIGVGEREGRAELPPVGLSESEAEAAQKWIRGHCNRLDPRYQPTLSPERVADRLVLVVWVPASDMRPHRAPASDGAMCYWVRLGSETVDAERRGDLLRGLIQQTARVPWDDRPERTARVEDMREAKVREFLREVRSGLLDEPDVREIYRRMRLIMRINDHEVPRHIGLLFFANDPCVWFRGAKIEVVQFAADRGGDVQEERVFGGSLLDQVKDCLNYIENLSVFHLQKQHSTLRAHSWRAFPLVAVREALMNAVYHRSYDVDQPEPTKVYLYPSRMQIASYPGPVPGIRPDHLTRNPKDVPVAPARNRRIGEFLKELQLAEGRLSGLPKIYAAMAANGSPTPRFNFDEERTYFQVTLPAHPQYVALSAARDAAHLRVAGNQQDAYRRLETALATNRSSPDAPAMLHEMAAMRAADSSAEPRLAWGVDGCKKGWFYIALGEEGEYCYGVVSSLREIVAKAHARDRVFVDIPIGLPDKSRPKPRKCDQEARWLLNRDRSGCLLPLRRERRGDSVFPAPARETLAADLSHEQAKEANKRSINKGISCQLYAILDKIRDADELLRHDSKARTIVREIHPELCFWAFNGKHPLTHNKSKKAGQDERLAILKEIWPSARPAMEEICDEYLRKDVAKDDIFDAMAAAITAKAGELNSLPERPESDSEELPMQMIWAFGETVV